MDKEVVNGAVSTASACCLALKDSYLRSQGVKDLDTQVLVIWIKTFIIQCWIKLNSTISINGYSPHKNAVRTRAPTMAINMQSLKTSYLDIHTKDSTENNRINRITRTLRSSCCFTHVVPNALAITLGVLPLLVGTFLI